MNTSRSSKCQSSTISALERNLRAKASSIKPSTTLTELSQPPDLGSPESQPGNRAKSVNGKARAMANPAMPTTGPQKLPLTAASTRIVPTKGPVHENDTKAKVKAMKKIPTSPARSDLRSILFTHEEGRVSSNAPKNEAAKTTNSTKKKMLNHGSVDIALSASAPKRAETPTPRIR